jgi:hypothetical protein
MPPYTEQLGPLYTQSQIPRAENFEACDWIKLVSLQ